MSETWTIGELAERAADVLRAPLEPGVPGLDIPQSNGRVRDVPNERLIRWYTTIGLLDPPLARRGRIALYGHRHLAQLVAVKRRQSAGLSIAEIQAELTGATDTSLEAIAQLPPALAMEPTPSPEGPRDRFWARPPTPDVHRPEAVEVTVKSPLAPGPDPLQAPDSPRGAPHAHASRDTHGTTPSPGFPPTHDTRGDLERLTVNLERDHPEIRDNPAPTIDAEGGRDPHLAGPSMTGRHAEFKSTPSTDHDLVGQDVEPERAARARHDVELALRERAVGAGPGHGVELVYGVRLAPGVALLLEGVVRAPSEDDLGAVAAAAQPLLDLLHERGLVTSSPWHSTSPAASPAASPASPAAASVGSDTDVVSRGEVRDNPDEGISA